MRVKYTRGSDKFEVAGVTFLLGGHSVEVPDEVGEELLARRTEDFEELSAEDAAAEDAVDKAAADKAEREARDAAAVEAADAEAGARRKAFYEGESVAEIEKKLGRRITESRPGTEPDEKPRRKSSRKGS